MNIGDKWNWALVATGLGVVVLALYVQYLNVLFSWRGGYHGVNHVSAGLGVIAMLLILNVCLFVMASVAAAWSKTISPFVGIAIGVLLQLPTVLVIGFLTSWAPASSTLRTAIQTTLGFCIVAAGIVRRPRTKAKEVQQSVGK